MYAVDWLESTDTGIGVMGWETGLASGSISMFNFCISQHNGAVKYKTNMENSSLGQGYKNQSWNLCVNPGFLPMPIGWNVGLTWKFPTCRYIVLIGNVCGWW